MLQRLCALNASEPRSIRAITWIALISNSQSGKTRAFYNFLSWIFFPCSPNAAGSVPKCCLQAALRMASSSPTVAPRGPPGTELRGFPPPPRPHFLFWLPRSSWEPSCLPSDSAPGTEPGEHVLGEARRGAPGQYLTHRKGGWCPGCRIFRGELGARLTL